MKRRRKHSVDAVIDALDEAPQPTRVRVLKRSFINSRIVEPGEVIEYSGPPAQHLQPVR